MKTNIVSTESILKVKHCNGSLDKTGILFSGFCAIHCALTSVLAVLAPNLSIHFQNEWFHTLLLFLIVPISGLAFFRSRDKNSSITPIIFGGVGVLLLLTAVINEKVPILEFTNSEVWLTVLGSVVLVIGHGLNVQYSKINK